MTQHKQLKKLQIYIIFSSSFSSSILFISSLASSSSEGEMNGFMTRLWSTKIDIWEFVFFLLALPGCPFFKQGIKSSSLASFARLKPQDWNDFMFSSDSWDQASSNHSIILFLEGSFISLPSVNWWISHWSCNPVILALNGLFQHTSDTWIYFVHPHILCNDATYIHLLQIFSDAVSHMAFVRVPR